MRAQATLLEERRPDLLDPIAPYHTQADPVSHGIICTPMGFSLVLLTLSRIRSTSVRSAVQSWCVIASTVITMSSVVESIFLLALTLYRHIEF